MGPPPFKICAQLLILTKKFGIKEPLPAPSGNNLLKLSQRILDIKCNGIGLEFIYSRNFQD